MDRRHYSDNPNDKLYKKNNAMKKFYSLICAALLAAPTFAASEVVLVSPDKTQEYTPGGTFTILPEVEGEGEELFVTFEAPQLRNKGTQDARVSISYQITNLPEGTNFNDCLGGECTTTKVAGNYTSKTATVRAGSTLSTLMEWLCFNENTGVYTPGTCTIVMTLNVDGTPTNTYTLNYTYETAGIRGITVGEKAQGTAFDLQGRRINARANQGLRIQEGKKIVR